MLRILKLTHCIREILILFFSLYVCVCCDSLNMLSIKIYSLFIFPKIVYFETFLFFMFTYYTVLD